MALSYQIYEKQTYALIVGSGMLTMSSMIEVVERAVEDPRFSSSYTIVVDLRNAEYQARLNDGDEFVAALKRRQEDIKGKFALVVPEQFHFLGRLYTVLASVGGIERMQCFTVLEEALEWCGLSK